MTQLDGLTCRSLQVDLLVSEHEDADTFGLKLEFGDVLEDNASEALVYRALDLQCVVSDCAIFGHLPRRNVSSRLF